MDEFCFIIGIKMVDYQATNGVQELQWYFFILKLNSNDMKYYKKKLVHCSEQRVFWQIRSISFQRETSKSQSCLTLNWKPDKLVLTKYTARHNLGQKIMKSKKCRLQPPFFLKKKSFSKKLKDRFSLYVDVCLLSSAFRISFFASLSYEFMLKFS